jgi:hypothetical protein
MPYKDKTKSLEAVKKHYGTHKDEVLKKRIINRILDGKIPQMASLEKFEITEDMVNEMRESVDLEPITIKQPRPKKEVSKVVTLQTIHDHYNQLAKDDKIAPRTAEGHYLNFKRVMKGIGCEDGEDLIECLKDPDTIIQYIRDLKNPKKEDATINTKHTYMTAVLNVIDTNPKLKNKVPRDAYKKEWDSLKEQKETSNTQKQLTEKVEKFSSIKERIENDNPDWSEEVLMINLYDEITPRNDFDTLTLDTSDPNHIDLDEGTITLRQFGKTNKTYAPIIDYNLSTKFMDLLKKSLAENPRDEVFSKKMRSIFKKAHTGINEIRHSKISEELSGENIKDQTKREALKETMLHSSATQLSYIRTLK